MSHKQINLVRSWDDHEPVILGFIRVPEASDTQGFRKDILNLWEEFKDNEPNSDNDFVEYLRNAGYKVYEDHIEDVLLK